MKNIVRYLKSKGISSPEVCIILGSGLGIFANNINISQQSDFDNFDVDTRYMVTHTVDAIDPATVLKVKHYFLEVSVPDAMGVYDMTYHIHEVSDESPTSSVTIYESHNLKVYNHYNFTGTWEDHELGIYELDVANNETLWIRFPADYYQGDNGTLYGDYSGTFVENVQGESYEISRLTGGNGTDITWSYSYHPTHFFSVSNFFYKTNADGSVDTKIETLHQSGDYNGTWDDYAIEHNLVMP